MAVFRVVEGLRDRGAVGLDAARVGAIGLREVGADGRVDAQVSAGAGAEVGEPAPEVRALLGGAQPRRPARRVDAHGGVAAVRQEREESKQSHGCWKVA